MPKETASQKRKIKRVMGEHKHGTLKSGKGGKGGKVKSRKQAVAIAMREAGVPKKKKTAGKAKKPGPKKKTGTPKKKKPSKK